MFAFAFLSALFLLLANAQNNKNLLKSLTATCDNSKNCTFSVVFYSTIPSTSYSGQLAITVGSEQQPTVRIEDVSYGNPQTFDFEITDNSQIIVNFLPDVSPPLPNIYFRVYNNAGGKGQVVQGSKGLKFQVPNPCQTTGCGFQFSRSFSWSANLYANFRVNDTIVATLNDTQQGADVNFDAFDILSIEIAGDTASIPDDSAVYLYYLTDLFFAWYANSIHTPLVFTGICVPPIPSPFGGLLIPISQEQINEFVKSIATSYYTMWYRETENQI